MIYAIYAHAGGLHWPASSFKAPNNRPEMPRIKNIAARVFQKLIQANREYRDMQKLRNMPDYLLRDMGINRSDIQRVSLIDKLLS